MLPWRKKYSVIVAFVLIGMPFRRCLLHVRHARERTAAIRQWRIHPRVQGFLAEC
jgi:hypothetical protein